MNLGREKLNQKNKTKRIKKIAVYFFLFLTTKQIFMFRLIRPAAIAAMLLLCVSVKAQSPDDFIKIWRGKDMVYRDTVSAKFYLYINDSTIKVVYGFHEYITYEYKREPYWGQEVEPTFLEGFLADDKKGFYTKISESKCVEG